jgi:hypothetical protein
MPKARFTRARRATRRPASQPNRHAWPAEYRDYARPGRIRHNETPARRWWRRRDLPRQPALEVDATVHLLIENVGIPRPNKLDSDAANQTEAGIGTALEIEQIAQLESCRPQGVLNLVTLDPGLHGSLILQRVARRRRAVQQRRPGGEAAGPDCAVQNGISSSISWLPLVGALACLARLRKSTVSAMISQP